MATESLREHLEWHLRRLKSARAAAAERSLRADADGLQWLTLTHFAVQALEATLAEDVAPDHSALAEVIADMTPAAALAAEPVPEASAAPPTREPPAVADSWTAALASLTALAFPWRPSPRPTVGATREPAAGGD